MDGICPGSPAKPLSQPVRFLAVGFIGLCVLFTAGIASLDFYPGLAILPFVSKARTSPCTVWQGVKDVQVKLTQADLEKKLLPQLHVVRKDGTFKLWSTPEGEYWVPDTSDDILAILLSQQKRKIYGTAETGGVKRGDIVLDGGAHIGVYVKTSLDAGAEKVIAIEPSPEALECLRRNFRKEIESGKVIVYPKGIWDEGKASGLLCQRKRSGRRQLWSAADAKPIADVPVTTVNKVKELNLPRVDIIKADIKGAGTRMIKGGVETIRAYRPRIVISVEEAPEDPAEIHDAILSTKLGSSFLVA